MTCSEVREYLIAFLDSELDAPLSIELQRHLERCPQCAREAEIERTTRQHLARALDEMAPASRFREDELVRALGRRMRGPRHAALSRPATLVASVAATFCILAGAWWGLRDRDGVGPSHGFPDRLIADFGDFVQQGRPVQLASADPGRVSAWLADQLGTQVPLPSSERASCNLIGARPCRVGDEPAGLVSYEMNGTPVVLVIIKDERFDLEGMQRVTDGEREHWVHRCKGRTVVACARNKLIYAAVSSLPSDSLLALVRGG
jgi:anti-sigma factor (TIGR02949 family)